MGKRDTRENSPGDLDCGVEADSVLHTRASCSLTNVNPNQCMPIQNERLTSGESSEPQPSPGPISDNALQTNCIPASRGEASQPRPSPGPKSDHALPTNFIPASRGEASEPQPSPGPRSTLHLPTNFIPPFHPSSLQSYFANMMRNPHIHPFFNHYQWPFHGFPPSPILGSPQPYPFYNSPFMR